MERQLLRLCVCTLLTGIISAITFRLEQPFGENTQPGGGPEYITKPLNADPMGFVGDFENIARQRWLEGRTKECRVPCKYPKETKVLIVGYRDDPEKSDAILDRCVYLDKDKEWFKKEGYYCLSYQQRDEKTSKCLRDPACQQYLGADCRTCPDTEVQFTCAGTVEDTIHYCQKAGLKYKPEDGGSSPPKFANNVRSLDGNRKMSFVDILSNLMQDRKDEALMKRRLQESEMKKRDQDTDDSDSPSSDDDENSVDTASKLNKKDEEEEENEEPTEIKRDESENRMLEDLLAKLL